MLKVLWVEDDKANIDEYKNELCKIFGEPIIPTSFKAACVYAKDSLAYDFVIIDIDLSKFFKIIGDPNSADVIEKTKFNEDIKKHISFEEKEAGIVIFNLLLEYGFPKDRMLFLTANVGSENQTYEKFNKYFNSALMLLPEYIDKNDTNKISEKLKKMIAPINSYLTLRRGIIDGCIEAKDNGTLYFNNYIKDKDNVQLEDIENYLDAMKNFFPLRKPEKKNELYKHFIRILSHEWEAANNIKPDRENKKDLAWIMKYTRHWTTHNSKLFSEVDGETLVDEKILAYLFIINLRMMFDYEDDKLKPYEEALLSTFDKVKDKVLDKLESNDVKIKVTDAYLDLRKKVSKENSTNNFFIDDNTFHFSELANNIQLSKSNLRNDKKLFSKLIYQMFWLITSNPLVDKKPDGNFLEIKFWEFKYEKKPYLSALARHIYHRSFTEE